MTDRILALLFLLAFFSACIDQSGEGDAGAWATRVFIPCDLQRDFCSSERLPDGRTMWTVAGLVLDATVPSSTGPTAAVMVTPSDNQWIAIRNTTIRSDGGGVYIAGMSCHNCGVILDNVTMKGENRGIGIFHASVPSASEISVELTSLTLVGFEEALHLAAGISDSGGTVYNVRFNDVQIICQMRGLTLWASHVQMHGYNASGCEADGATMEISQRATIANSAFLESRTGLWVRSEEGALVELFSSVIDRNRVLGVDGQGTGRLELTDVTLTNNGHGAGSDFGGGLLTWPQGFIHASTIAGNQELGVHPGGSLAYDATDNYWGDQNGPRVLLSPADPVGVGQGDAVNHQVVFYPYRTTPPQGAVLAGTPQPVWGT